MLAHKIGMVIVNATDNLIISKILGLAVLGVYSNYVLLTQTIESFVTKIFFIHYGKYWKSGSRAVKRRSSKKILTEYFFLNYWIIAFCSICLICLIQPFIHLWLGADYQLPMFTVLIIIVVFYFNGMRRTVLEFRNAAGLFWADRYKALVESFVNLVVSIPLTYALGVAGVKLGTLISLLGVAFLGRRENSV